MSAAKSPISGVVCVTTPFSLDLSFSPLFCLLFETVLCRRVRYDVVNAFQLLSPLIQFQIYFILKKKKIQICFPENKQNIQRSLILNLVIDLRVFPSLILELLG